MAARTVKATDTTSEVDVVDDTASDATEDNITVSGTPVNENVQSLTMPDVEGADLKHLTDDDFCLVQDANGNVQPHAVPKEWVGTHLLPHGWTEHQAV